DCDVAEDRLSLEPLDRHILIPVEHSRLDRLKKRVVVDGIFSSDVSGYPVYGGLPLVGDVERRIEAIYDRAETRAAERSRVDELTDPSDPASRFCRMRRRRATDLEDRRTVSVGDEPVEERPLRREARPGRAIDEPIDRTDE